MKKGFATLIVLLPVVLLLSLSIHYFSIDPIESSALSRHAHMRGVILHDQLEQLIEDRLEFHLSNGLRDPVLLEETLAFDLTRLSLIFPEWNFHPTPSHPFKVLTIPLPEGGYLITLFLVPSPNWVIRSNDGESEFVFNSSQQWVKVVS